MQITRQTEYAVRTLLELAAAEPGTFVAAKVISEKQDIPEVFLKKTIQLLARAGLVATQRGTQGGVRLAQPADRVTLADVLTAVEGPLALNPCLAEGYDCPNQASCPVRRIIARAQAAMVRELSRETLADMLRGQQPGGVGRQQRAPREQAPAGQPAGAAGPQVPGGGKAGHGLPGAKVADVDVPTE